MTQYPQAQPTYPPPPGPIYMPPPGKTSGLALAGFICSLIICCPGLGVLGAILSFAGLFTTGQPGMKGRGLAIAGLIIGLVVTLGQGVLGVQWWKMSKEGDRAVAEFLDDYNRKDFNRIYDQSSPLLREATSREQVINGMAEVYEVWGPAERSSTVGFSGRSGFNLNAGFEDRSVVVIELIFQKGGKQPAEFTFNWDKDGRVRIVGVRFPTFVKPGPTTRPGAIGTIKDKE